MPKSAEMPEEKKVVEPHSPRLSPLVSMKGLFRHSSTKHKSKQLEKDVISDNKNSRAPPGGKIRGTTPMQSEFSLLSSDIDFTAPSESSTTNKIQQQPARKSNHSPILSRSDSKTSEISEEIEPKPFSVTEARDFYKVGNDHKTQTKDSQLNSVSTNTSTSDNSYEMDSLQEKLSRLYSVENDDSLLTVSNPYLNSNELHKVHSLPSNRRKRTNSSGKVNGIPQEKEKSKPVRGRPHAATISLKHVPEEVNQHPKNYILRSDGFILYETGQHTHNFDLAPLLSQSVHAATNGEANHKGHQDSLLKQTSGLLVPSFLKIHGNSSHRDDPGKLAQAVSLLPSETERFLEAFESNADESEKLDDEVLSTMQNSDLPEIVNDKAAVGPRELKLITSISEQIKGVSKSRNVSPAPSILSKASEEPQATKGQLLGPKFVNRYGSSIGVIGHGSYGTVRLSCIDETDTHPIKSQLTYTHNKKQYFAVKELRSKPTDKIEDFSARLTSEFIIGLSLSHYHTRGARGSHPNIINIFDLMQKGDVFYEVMEFCPAGDLYTIIANKNKSGLVFHCLEADCLMKQLLRGILFMHSHGVAHCDLKPENLLLYPNGTVKICDFGTSCVFQTAWERRVHFKSGLNGSEPYIAPEEYINDVEYDPRLADSWSCGVIYCVMVWGHYLWKTANAEKDSSFKSFMHEMSRKKQYSAIEELRHINQETNRLRKLALYSIFQVNPAHRISVERLLKTNWMKYTRCCVFYRCEV